MGTQFIQSTVLFFAELSANNTKEWFETNKSRYETSVLKPAKTFVTTLGDHLQKHSPNIRALPKINQSLFKIHRDTRFSPDKTPYKTNFGMMFWEGDRKRLENPGLYIHLAPEECFIATGLHAFSKDVLVRYQNVVSDEKKALELDLILNALSDVTELRSDEYKQVPRGFDKLHPFAHLLKKKGIHTYHPFSPEHISSDELIDLAIQQFLQSYKLHQWFLTNV